MEIVSNTNTKEIHQVLIMFLS